MLGKKQRCVTCHFFTKVYTDRERQVLGVTEEERKQTEAQDFSWAKEYYSLSCYCGVWDEGYHFNKQDRFKTVVETDRRDFCFFFTNKPGMFLPAAKILQEREAEARKASKDRRLTILGLWVAGIALIINAYLTVAESHQWCPF